MTPEQIIQLTTELIAIRSLSGNERGATTHAARFCESLGWQVELLPVAEERENLFVSFGQPNIVFTTHLDVVPAPEALFTPRREGDKLIGRGACDAKGIAATLIGVCDQLRKRGRTNFGLLLVVGEEVDGIGARSAAQALQGHGIRYIVNGEPTEGRLMTAHKGALGAELRFIGTACHSGYPELGEDANRKMIEVCAKLLAHDFGESARLGKATINIGRLDGGVQANVVSPAAEIELLIRTVTPNAPVIDQLEAIAGRNASVHVTYNMDPIELLSLPGFETDVANYGTDIPCFAPLGAPAVLYGPGSIHRAHTDHEYITIQEIEDACDGYLRIFDELNRR